MFLFKEAQASRPHIVRNTGFMVGFLAILMASCSTPQATSSPELTHPELTRNPNRGEMSLDCSGALTSDEKQITSLNVQDDFWLQKGENVIGQELGVKLTYQGSQVLNYNYIEYLPLGIRSHVEIEKITDDSSKLIIHSNISGDKVFTATLQTRDKGAVDLKIQGACVK